MLADALKPEDLVREFLLDGDDRVAERVLIVQDFYAINFEFSQQEGFTDAKISVFVELMHFVLYKCLQDRLD